MKLKSSVSNIVLPNTDNILVIYDRYITFNNFEKINEILQQLGIEDFKILFVDFSVRMISVMDKDQIIEFNNITYRTIETEQSDEIIKKIDNDHDIHKTILIQFKSEEELLLAKLVLNI